MMELIIKFNKFNGQKTYDSFSDMSANFVKWNEIKRYREQCGKQPFYEFPQPFQRRACTERWRLITKHNQFN